jgi:hypothetical protein
LVWRPTDRTGFELLARRGNSVQHTRVSVRQAANEAVEKRLARETVVFRAMRIDCRF